MPRRISFTAVAIFAFFASAVHAAEWRQFRGPGGLGASDETGLPVQWSSAEQISWKTPLPGAGSSSPIVVGDRVFLTCYSGYAQDEGAPGEQADLMRHIVCLDRKSGKILWTKEFEPLLPESRYEGNGARHGYSSSTPASDGERLYVFFGKLGVYCFDLDGKQLWHTSVGTQTHNWGSSNSPVLHKNLVIINAAVESRSLIALDQQTGEEVWRDDDIRGSWNTPLLVDVPNGGTELVLCVPQQVLGLNPDTGERLWKCDGIPDRGYVCPSVVAHEGIVYAIGGRQNTALAVRAGGRGDVTNTHLLWKTNKGSNVSSPVYHDGRIYWTHERSGVVFCLDADSGELVFQDRLAPRPGVVYSSMTLADGKLYVASQHAGIYVLAAGPEFELLAHNVFADDDSRINACMVVDDGQLLVRTGRALYCIGK